MDFGQFGGADFKSDVCQIVNVEHFFLWQKIQDGHRKISFFLLKASKLLHLDLIYVWKMNMNLVIVIILVSQPSLYLVSLLRYGFFIVSMSTVYRLPQVKQP